MHNDCLECTRHMLIELLSILLPLIVLHHNKQSIMDTVSHNLCSMHLHHTALMLPSPQGEEFKVKKPMDHP